MGDKILQPLRLSGSPAPPLQRSPSPLHRRSLSPLAQLLPLAIVVGLGFLTKAQAYLTLPVVLFAILATDFKRKPFGQTLKALAFVTLVARGDWVALVGARPASVWWHRPAGAATA